jgi:predicted enzyme related to lactoylglutathione lyase
MSQGVSLLVYPVADLAAAKALFTALTGAEPYVDSAYYVGYRVGAVEIGLDPHGPAGAGPIGYWEVEDIKHSLQTLLDAGAQLQQDVRDVGAGKLIAQVKDANGSIVGIMQAQ